MPPFHVIIVIATLLTLLLGAKSIEKTNKVMMPVFFVIFVILAIRVSFLPGAAAGYKFMFTPDWSMLKNPMTWIWIMKKEDLLEEINKGCAKPHGDLWYNAGRFLYVLCALVLCLVALFMKVAF